MVLERTEVEANEKDENSSVQSGRKRHLDERTYARLSGTDREHEVAKHRAKSIAEAIKRGLFKQVRFLVALNIDVNEREEMDSGKAGGDVWVGRTPLMLCCFVRGDDWGVGLAQNLLEKGASVGIRDMNGRNALHYACIFVRSKLVFFL